MGRNESFSENRVHPIHNKRLNPMQFVRSKSAYLICFQRDSVRSSFNSCVINGGFHSPPPPLGISRPGQVGLQSKPFARQHSPDGRGGFLSEYLAQNGELPERTDNGWEKTPRAATAPLNGNVASRPHPDRIRDRSAICEVIDSKAHSGFVPDPFPGSAPTSSLDSTEMSDT